MIAATRSQTGATTETPIAWDADPLDQLAGTHHHHHKSPRMSASTDLEHDIPVSATGTDTPNSADSPHTANAQCRILVAITGIIFEYSKIDLCIEKCLLSVSPTDDGTKIRKYHNKDQRKIGRSESKNSISKRQLGSIYPDDLYERIDKVRKIRNDLAHSTSGVDETKTIAHSKKHKTYEVMCLECARDEAERCAIEFKGVMRRYRSQNNVSGNRAKGY